MIKKVSWLDIVPASLPIATRDRDSGVDGNVSDFELDCINRLIKLYDPQTIFEIGTFDGRTTLNMAAHSSVSARVYTLDLPASDIDATDLPIEHSDRLFIDKPKSGSRFAGTDVSHKITQLYGDSATFDFEPFYGKVDFMFVDGSHSYEYVLSDSKIAIKMVRPGGAILWHDYVSDGPTPWPGVPIAIRELNEQPQFANMINVAGTAIVYLPIPGPGLAIAAPDTDALLTAGWADSRQPEYLLASLSIAMAQPKVTEGSTISVKVEATNIGQTTWLPSGSASGPVRLGSRLLDPAGTWLNASYSRNFLPGDVVAPGEKVSFDADIPSPKKGKYILEFDLVAEGVAWFSRNGSQRCGSQLRLFEDYAEDAGFFQRRAAKYS